MDDVIDRAVPSPSAFGAAAGPGTFFLHPYVVARIGGEPVSLITRTTAASTAAALAEAHSLRSDLDSRKGALTDDLEHLFHDLSAKNLGNRLLQLKRDIFNCRGVRLHAALAEALPESVTERVERHLQDACLLTALELAIPDVYLREVQERREELRGLWARDNLRTGILCSNYGLYQQLNKIMQTAGGLPSGKKVAHLCDSLLSYAARTALKASPFSTFTLIWVGEWAAGGERPTGIEIVSLPIRRHVEIKQAALMHALEPIWSNLDALGEDFPLTLNPTLRQQGSELAWSQLYRSAYRHHKVWGHNSPEITVAVSSVRAIFRVFQLARAERIGAAEIMAHLGATEADSAKQRAFVMRLLELQLLTPAMERFDQEPLLGWLASTLRRMGSEQSAKLLRTIEALEVAMASSKTALEAERPVILAELDGLMRTLAADAGAHLPPSILTSSVFEDCFVDKGRFRLDPSMMQDVTQDLECLLELVPALDFNHVMQSLIAKQFIDQFGPDGICSDPSSFFQNVTEKYFGQESEIDMTRMAKLHEDQMSLESGRAIHNVRRDFLQHIANAKVVAGVIELDRVAIAALKDSFPESIKARPLSQCFTGQFAARAEGDVFVLNQILPGASGLMSRFLSDLDGTEMTRVVDYLRRVAPTGRFAEIPAVFGFNANLHPMLADEEIGVPGAAGGYSRARKLPLSELSISYSHEADRIVLRDERGPIDPFYFGFMAPGLLPSRLRTLTMTSTQNKILYISREVELVRGADPTQVLVLPRIMLGTICLARRSHVFPHALRPDHNLDDGAFFAAVWRWRREWKLPGTAYWRLLPAFPVAAAHGPPPSPKQGMDAALKGQAEFDPTAFKPAFIDFDDPLHVRIFRRALARNNFDLAVEEPFPTPEAHELMVAGERHVCELQFELSRAGSKVR